MGRIYPICLRTLHVQCASSLPISQALQLAVALRKEVGALQDAGCRIIQVSHRPPAGSRQSLQLSIRAQADGLHYCIHCHCPAPT